MLQNKRHYLLIILLLDPAMLWACATCLCGDPTITTMGTEKPFAGRMRVGVDYTSRSETAGVPGRSEHKISEQRLTYNFSYAVTDKWMLAASLPMVDKQVERYDLSEEKASGMGDGDVSARWFVGGSDSFPADNLWGMQFGLRLPTSSEQKTAAEVIDFDAQPGAGTTIPSIGLWYGHYRMPWFFYVSSSVLHAIDKGYQGYEAGDVLLVTGHLQYALNYQLALQFSLDGRWKAKDHYNSLVDNNSGGFLLMSTPGLAWTPLEDLVINFNYQIPFIDNLNGYQEEHAVLRTGVTYDF